MTTSSDDPRTTSRCAFYLGPLLLAFAVVFLLRTVSAPDVLWDEVCYITLSQHLALGIKPFTEITTVMHMGATPAAPLFWIRQQIVGGPEGIWLFSRLVFAATNLLLGYAVYRTFRRELGHRFAVGVGTACACYVGLHPCLYYDSVGSIFLLFGSLLLFAAMDTPPQAIGRYGRLCGAGALLAIMVYGYAPLVGVALYFALPLAIPQAANRSTPRQRINSMLCLAAGASAVLAAFLLYVSLVLGWSQFLAGFREMAVDVSSGNTSPSADIPPKFSPARLLMAGHLIVKVYAYLAASAVALFIAALASRRVRRVRAHLSWQLAMVGAVLASPILALLLKEARLPSILASFLTFCGFGFYLLLRKKTRFIRNTLLVFWVPAILAQITYCLSGSLITKLVSGHYSGIVAFTVFAAALVNEGQASVCGKQPMEDGRPARLGAWVSLWTAAMLLLSYFLRTIFSPTLPDAWRRMHFVDHGILRGMLVEDRRSEHVDRLEKTVAEYVENADSVFFGEFHKTAYLMTEKTPLCGNVWGPTRTYVDGNRRSLARLFTGELEQTSAVTVWEDALLYFRRRGTLPDIILVTPLEASSPEAVPFLTDHYTVLRRDSDAIVYTLDETNR